MKIKKLTSVLLTLSLVFSLGAYAADAASGRVGSRSVPAGAPAENRELPDFTTTVSWGNKVEFSATSPRDWKFFNPKTGKTFLLNDFKKKDRVAITYAMAEPMFIPDGYFADFEEKRAILVYEVDENNKELPHTASFDDFSIGKTGINPPDLTFIVGEFKKRHVVVPAAGWETWGEGKDPTEYPSAPDETETEPSVLAAQDDLGSDPVRLEVEYKYQDENGKIAGIIAPGWYVENPNEQSYTVTFHEIEGYKPYIQNDDGTLHDESEKEHTFNKENGKYESETVTVVYVPQEVTYTVKLCKEKLDGEYEETLLSDDREAKTGSKIDMDQLCCDLLTDKQKEGFGEPFYKEIPRVKGDGSTVVKIYMDRRYFFMDFDLGEGGYGVEPVYDKYGALIPPIGKPTRPGYTFNGWKLADEDGNPTGDLISSEDLPEIMPAEDRTYVADWEMNTPVNVIVNIWGEEANTEDYELYSSQKVQSPSGEAFDASNIYFCGKEEHTHTDECYSLVKTDRTSKEYFGIVPLNDFYYWDGGTTWWDETYSPISDSFPKDPTDGQIFKYEGPVGGNTPDPSYHIFKDGDWYYAERQLTCGKEEHTHGPECSTMDSNLWVRVEPVETPVVNPDGSTVVNVYYDRTEKTLHFRNKNSNKDDFGSITAKWGSNIADEWDAACEAGSCHNWSEKQSGESPWTSGVRVMFKKDKFFYKGSDSGGGTSQATYWGEKLDASGEYEIIYTATADGRDLRISIEDFLEFEGFTSYEPGETVPSVGKNAAKEDNYNGAKFYYKRNNYKVFYVNTPNETQEQSAKFEQPLNQNPYNDYKPDYPSNLEPDAYNFDAWCKDPTCIVEMDWNKTMPAKNVTVYARWIPVTRTVTFRLNEDDDIPSEEEYILTPHGYLMEGDIPEDPEKEGFDFVGWFYKDEDGKEHAFKPDQTPVRADMHLYAKWKSTTQYKYTINYYLEGTTTSVAEPTVGVGEPGAEFTVYAKKGYSEGHPSELFWEYWQFFTPTKESLEVTLVEDDMEFTFYYKEAEATITYVPVPVTGEQGSVSLGYEKIGKVTGKPAGSTPQPAENYKFVGWYEDELCTNPVPESWVDAAGKITPQRTSDAGVPTAGTSTLWVFEDKTYYAKFELDVADLTVTKEVDDTYSDDDIFVFTVTGPDDFKTELSIKASELENGTASVVIRGLKVGEYTVTEDAKWSWRYKCENPNASQTVNLTANGANEATFANVLTNEQWLDANARAVNECGKSNQGGGAQ